MCASINVTSLTADRLLTVLDACDTGDVEALALQETRRHCLQLPWARRIRAWLALFLLGAAAACKGWWRRLRWHDRLVEAFSGTCQRVQEPCGPGALWDGRQVA